MAGFIFAVSKKNGLATIEKCFADGAYGTEFDHVKLPHSNAFEATLADYCSMREGDNVYFFSDRKIYGVGVLTNLITDCRMQNYPHSCDSSVLCNANSCLYIDNGNVPWVCFFQPYPVFFKDALDMDDVLLYKPETFNSLRTFWKKSFVKIDDAENQSLKECFALNCDESSFFEFNGNRQKAMQTFLYKNKYDDYLLHPEDCASACCKGTDQLDHEMALEALVVERLTNTNGWPGQIERCDFVTHQLCASPFKPVDYMDRIDVFGYRVKNVGNSSVPYKYVVIELKKGTAHHSAIVQLAKYVDWVCQKYAYGNYGRIEAHLIAYDYDNDVFDDSRKPKIPERFYNTGSHPILERTWSDLSIWSYRFNGKSIDLVKAG